MSVEWSNKDFAGASLRGARVVVLCQAPDETIRRICEDKLAATLNARGATAARLPGAASVQSQGPVPADNYRPAAKAVGATAIVSMVLEPGVVAVSSGPQIGIGIGGGSGGWSRSGGSWGGVGAGVSLPVGGATTQQGLAASTTVLDAASGQTIWSGRATAPASANVDAQLQDLTRVTLDAIQKAGYL